MKITIEAGPNMEDLMDSLEEYIFVTIAKAEKLREWSEDQDNKDLIESVDHYKAMSDKLRDEIINNVNSWGG